MIAFVLFQFLDAESITCTMNNQLRPIRCARKVPIKGSSGMHGKIPYKTVQRIVYALISANKFNVRSMVERKKTFLLCDMGRPGHQWQFRSCTRQDST